MESYALAAFGFSAGVATFFAPCAYPLLPGYVAYYISDDSGATHSHSRRLWRALIVSAGVCLGFALVYLAVVAVLFTLGSQVLWHVILLEPIVAAVLITLGTAMALGYSLSNTVSRHVSLPERRRSLTAYVSFGVLYAAAAIGCTAPIFLGIAGVSLRGGPTTTLLGLGSYALGMCVLLVAVTVLSALGRQTALRFLSQNTARLSRIAGVLLIGAGLAQLYLFAFEFGGLRYLGL